MEVKVLNMTNVDKIQGQKISAITLTVSDGDRLRDFYEQTLGFNCISDIMLKDAHSNLPGIAKAKIRLLTLQLGD
jgi:catechol-2,3-dioxygenase